MENCGEGTLKKRFSVEMENDSHCSSSSSSTIKKPRSQSSAKSTFSAVDKNSALACAALEVVLQHLMVPDQLGWYVDVFEERLPSLKEETVEAKAHALSINDLEKEENREKFQQELTKKPLHFNHDEIPFLEIHLRAIPMQDMLPSETVPRDEDDNASDDDGNGVELVYYRKSDFYDIIHKMYKKFWFPVSLSLQFQSTHFALELRSTFVNLQLAVYSFFQQQRQAHCGNGNGNGQSIVVYQLHHFLQWKTLMDYLVEKVLFSFALIPCLLEAERRLFNLQEFCESMWKKDPLMPSMRMLGNTIERARCLLSKVVIVSRLAELLARPISEPLQQFSDVFYSTNETLKSLTLHVMQMQQCFTSNGHRRPQFLRAMQQQYEHSFNEVLGKNMEKLYDMRHEVQKWFHNQYLTADRDIEANFPKYDKHTLPFKMIHEVRYIRSFACDLDFIHRSTMFFSPQSCPSCDDVFSISYRSLNVILGTFYHMLEEFSFEERQKIVKHWEFSQLCNDNLAFSNQRSQQSFQDVEYALKRCFQTLSIRRYMIDAVETQRMYGMGCHYHAKHDACIFRREVTELIQEHCIWTNQLVRLRLSFENEGQEQDAVDNYGYPLYKLQQRVQNGKNSMDQHMEQIMSIAYGSLTDNISVLDLAFQPPILANQLPSNAKNRLQVLQRRKDELAHLHTRSVNVYLSASDTHIQKEAENYVFRLWQKAIKYLQEVQRDSMFALYDELTVDATRNKEAQQQQVMYELVSRAYESIAEVLLFHMFQSHQDEEDLHRYFTVTKKWINQLNLCVARWEMLTEMEAHEIEPQLKEVYMNLHKCQVLSMLFGCSTRSLLYSTGFYVSEQSYYYDDDFTRVQLWNHINVQLTRFNKEVYGKDADNNSQDDDDSDDDSFDEKKLLPKYFALSMTSTQTIYLQEELFWFEKALTLGNMEYEAREYFGERLLKEPYYPQEIHSKYFKDAGLLQIYKRCERFETRAAIECYDDDDELELMESLGWCRSPTLSVSEITNNIKEFLGITDSYSNNNEMVVMLDQFTDEMKKISYEQEKEKLSRDLTRIAIDLQVVMKRMYESQCEEALAQPLDYQDASRRASTLMFACRV